MCERVHSTNDVLRRRGLAGAPAGATAIAEHQTGGRGRLGRPWVAPPGQGLLISVLLRPGEAGQAAAAGALPLRVGLAVVRALQEAAGIRTCIKWPNDVLAGGRKLAGILCEAAGDFVVAGIGINVHQLAGDFPPALRARATSLRIETGNPGDRPRLAGTLLRELAPLFAAPHRPLEPAELAEFAALDALAGHPVAVDDVVAGTAAGVDPLGALLISGPAGLRTCHGGTVRRVS